MNEPKYFFGRMPGWRTPRSCRVCLQPATTELYKAAQRGPKRGQPNPSSRIFLCGEHTPETGVKA